MSRLVRLLPLLGLATLMLFLVLLTLFGVRRPASFRFPVEPGRDYDVSLLERPSLRERYSYNIRDQDIQDHDPSLGLYELRVPNAEEADLELRREARSETQRELLERTELPSLPATPFQQGERAWVTLSENVRKLQGGGDGATGAMGRVVDISRGDQPAILGGGCDALTVAVHPGGHAMAVVRPADDGHRLEVWSRRPDERWERSTLLAELKPPVDPVWEGDAIVFLERRTGGGTLRRWRFSERTLPEAVADVPAQRLLAAGEGLFWLSDGRQGEFLLVDGTGRAIPFRAHPSLQLLRAYIAPQDAFLVRFPALGREGIDLVLRRRLGESSRLIRRLPESVLMASASSDLAVIVGVERCGDPME